MSPIGDQNPETGERRKRSVFGRRKGIALKGRQAELIDSFLPSVTIPAPGIDDAIVTGSLDPYTFFNRPVDGMWLEVGFGGGEHLAWQAEHNPNIGFLGCEPFINGVAKLLPEIIDRKLDNVRVQPDDARPLMEALPDASIDKAFLLFPDPWHKKRHNKRRFVSDENLNTLSRIMKDGAEFRVGTDIMDYCRWTLDHIQRHPDFDWTAEGPEDWRIRGDDWPQTRYEAKAVRAGRTPVYLRFLRKSRA